MIDVGQEEIGTGTLLLVLIPLCRPDIACLSWDTYASGN